MLLRFSYVPSFVWVKLPIPKSIAPRTRIPSSKNCSLMTHLTPAKLIRVSITMTKAAMLLSIKGLGTSFSDNNPAMDSPNPVAHNAFPIAWNQIQWNINKVVIWRKFFIKSQDYIVQKTAKKEKKLVKWQQLGTKKIKDFSPNPVAHNACNASPMA